MGISPPAVTAILNSTREIQLDELPAMAGYLQLSIAQVLENLQLLDRAAGGRGIVVPLLGSVQAEHWVESYEWPPAEHEEIVVPKPNSYQGLFALQLIGPSMNADYPDGSIAILCPINQYPHDLLQEPPWDHVLVVRHGENALTEATIKELRVTDDGQWWLWPKSNHPDHQSPFALPYGDPLAPPDQKNVEIRAVVVADYRKRR